MRTLQMTKQHGLGSDLLIVSQSGDTAEARDLGWCWRSALLAAKIAVAGRR